MQKPFLTLLLSILFTAIVSSQDYYMSSPTGFGENTTGGGNAAVITVNTRDALKSALKASGSSVIVVTENITFGEGEMISEVIKNKTLLGLKGVKLISTARVKDGGILGLKSGSDNVIIRNLIFEGPGAFDVDGRDLLQNTGCTNLWVDHCEFYDGVDGNFDNTVNADNITISWCKFGYQYPSKTEGMTGDGSGEHRYSNLIGGASSDYPPDGHYSITFQYCYWSDGCAQRMPRARNAELHILNCYYNTNVSGALAIGLGAGSKGTTCYVEGSDFRQIGRVVNTSYDEVSGQSVAVNFINCLTGGGNLGTVSKPSYTYTVLDENQVEAAVTGSCGAGATLEVTLTGEISAPCLSQQPLIIPENVTATATDNSVTVNWDAVESATGYRVKLCYDSDGVSETVNAWDFTGAWTISESDADANLVLDTDDDGISKGRFNYKSSTSSQELTFANGSIVPDTEGLLFTAGADTKLRLGFDTGLLYLNGGGIIMEIPCTEGSYITIEAMSGNADATDRGFSVMGGIADPTGTSDNISNGILTQAGETGTWSFIASGNSITVTTVKGGMNILRITEISNPSGKICDEYDVPVEATSHTVENLTEDKEYSYQVKAIRDNEETQYSTANTVITKEVTAIKNASGDQDWQLLQTADELTISGLDVQELSLFNAAGSKIATVYNSQTINSMHLPEGLYILLIKTADSNIITKKIIKRQI